MKVRRFLLISALLFPFVFTYASAQEPGSAEDPLVSRSYVDAAIANAMSAQASAPAAQPAAEGGAFKPVSLSAGEILIGGEGTEIILRSGNAAAYQSGEDGIVNITSGTELLLGDNISKNNLLIVPRADGRGVKALEESWLLVKGGYQINNG